MMEHLWNSYYVQMRITYREHSRDGKVKTYTDTFECDQHIAEAIRLFNEKGYATGNCCEGHPYHIIPDNNQRKYKNTAYFDGGYISFCSIEDKKFVLDKLKEKSSFFSEDTHSKMTCVRTSLEWKPIRSAEVDGLKYSQMQYENMTKIFKMIYTELWRVLLEVAQELPYKETDDPWILKAEILDKPLKPHFANVQGLKTFEEV